MTKSTPALIIAINEALEEKYRVMGHRRFTVHSYEKKRTEKSQFNVIYEVLRRFPDKYFSYY
jgi:hypothetical protein